MAKEYYKVDPIIYSEYLFYKVYLKSRNQNYPLWIYFNENFKMRPSFENPKCLFWQFKHDQSIKNFGEKADLNAFIGDWSDFNKILVK
jgi:GH25 family lysozyme M1 (1,4-beta-N-acetylmuramidase)